MRRLTTLWNWLPAFRAVAETQNLPDASKELHVSPSALSRTIRLLEEDIGQPVFTRAARALELNPTGQRLLSAVRDSMRMIDEALEAIAQKQYVGPVKIATSPPVTERWLLPAVRALKKDHSHLVPHFLSADADQINGLLLRGHIDVAFDFSAHPNDDVEIVKVVDLTTSIYAGSGHPLYGSSSQATLARLLEHEFVAPVAQEGSSADGWPSDRRRRIGAQADLAEALVLCEAGMYLALLPDEIARAHPELVALSTGTTSPITLFAVQRKSLGFEGRAELIIHSVLAEIEAAC